jgi:uncharacterized membrane protein
MLARESRVVWHRPLIPTVTRLRQENHKFQASQDYIMSSGQKEKRKKKKKKKKNGKRKRKGKGEQKAGEIAPKKFYDLGIS